MKNILLVICSFLIFTSWSQMSDSFDDGDFTNNPTWVGDVGDFIVNTNKQLQLNATGTGESYLSTPHNLTQLDDREWRYKIRYNFSPSNNNRGSTYLTATDADLSTDPDGIYFRIGENLANDPIELIERSGGIETTILTSTPAIVAASFDITVKVIYRASGDWELYTDLTGGSAFNLDISANYPVIFSGQHLGIWLKYTSGNSTNFYYDDFYAGPIVLDTDPPSISSVTPISATQLKVLFDEAVDQASGEDVLNYTINNGIGNPISIQQDGSDMALFTLTFGTPFVIGNTYVLTANNVEDIAGNAMVTQSESFMYVEAQVPEYGDIIINEFIPRTNPVVGLPNVQFVELYNRSNKYFNLNGWKLSDNNSSGTIQDVWLNPGEYLILVPTNGLIDYPQAISVTSWANLNLTGDDIELATAGGIVVDYLRYTDAWYKDESKKSEGWSIERINPDLLCSTAGNWRASIDPSGGTPGVQNSVYDNTPDTDAPTVTNVQVVLPNQLIIQFSEGMDTVSLNNATFTSSPSLTIASRSHTGAYPNEVTLTFNETFGSGNLYSFTFNGFADCSGNTNSYTGDFVLPQTPVYGDIVINEFIPKESPAVGMPEVQFVELYNRSNKYFYLNGYSLSDNSSSGTIQGGWLYPGEYLLLVPTAAATDYPQAVTVTSWANLNITGDDVRLATDNGVVIDELTYTDAWYKDNDKKIGGWSIERINPDLLCSSVDNWRASNNVNGGTPGVQNSVFDNTPDTQAPTVIGFETQSPSRLVIKFSERMDSLSLVNAGFTSTPDLTIVSRNMTSRYPTEMSFDFNEVFVPGELYSFTLSNFFDCSGNTNNYNGTFVLPQTPVYGDLIINEILFNTLTGGSDFVEIYNNSNKYIDLKDWELGNYKNDTVANQKKVTKSYVLKPHDYVVLTADSNFQMMNYPVAVPGKFIHMSSLPSYTNDSSTVYLIFNNEIMDKVSYSEKWHFSLLQSKKGVSLERFSADQPSNTASNWHSASETIGFATPGRKNSQAMKPNQDGGTLSLSSKSFSPDGDGFEDVLVLTYDVSSPDLLGDLIIYDDKGRLIKTLFKRELLGGTGSVKWEGTKEDGTKASIGPYIIMFDVFDLNSSKIQSIRKVVTLSGRL